MYLEKIINFHYTIKMNHFFDFNITSFQPSKSVTHYSISFEFTKAVIDYINQNIVSPYLQKLKKEQISFEFEFCFYFILFILSLQTLRFSLRILLRFMKFQFKPFCWSVLILLFNVGFGALTGMPLIKEYLKHNFDSEFVKSVSELNGILFVCLLCFNYKHIWNIFSSIIGISFYILLFIVSCGISYFTGYSIILLF